MNYHTIYKGKSASTFSSVNDAGSSSVDENIDDAIVVLAEINLSMTNCSYTIAVVEERPSGPCEDPFAVCLS